jgi:exosortase D (VPLPA-CTERM-specific)
MATSPSIPLEASSPNTVWRLSPALVLTGITMLVLLTLLCWDGLLFMWGWWITLPEYSHALLIPPVVLFLIWQQRDRIEQTTFSGSWWGVLLVLIGGALLLLGQLGTVFTLVQYAFVVALYGMVLALTGSAAFRMLLTPLLLLLLMIPLPQFLLANLSTKLQLLSSQLGVGLIRLFGVSVFLQGNVIDLGGYQLEVADACSGLRYLFPLMTLGFLMAYFYKGAMWKRVLLFLSSIPLTVLMNSFRVGLIGITVDRWGIGMAEGFLHEFQGWALFMVCAGLMLAEMAALNRIGHESGTWRQLFGIELPAPSPKHAVIRRRGTPGSFVAAGALLAAFFVASLISPRPTEIHPARVSLVEFPLQFGDWRGRSGPMDSVYLDQLKLDDYLLADYSNISGQDVNFYVAWYDSQRKGYAIHSPRSCLPGGGWQMRDFGPRLLPQLAINGQPLQVNRALIELGNQRQLVYYWFQQRGRIIDNEFVVKWYLFWDALSMHRTDGSLVRLMTPLPPGGGEADADRRLTEFAAQVVPQLPRFIPN